jgi:hypothetical protein
LPCSDKASGWPRAMMNHWLRGWLTRRSAVELRRLRLVLLQDARMSGGVPVRSGVEVAATGAAAGCHDERWCANPRWS